MTAIIHTSESIEYEVLKVRGTHIKRNNLRRLLTISSNQIIQCRIDRVRAEIRALKSAGVKEFALAPVYAKITQLELRLL